MKWAHVYIPEIVATMVHFKKLFFYHYCNVLLCLDTRYCGNTEMLELSVILLFQMLGICLFFFFLI